MASLCSSVPGPLLTCWRLSLHQVGLNALWACTPVVVTLVAFVHYVWWRQLPLTPSIAFTAIAVFGELRFALMALPETFVSVIQGFVSLRRIEKVRRHVLPRSGLPRR